MRRAVVQKTGSPAVFAHQWVMCWLARLPVLQDWGLSLLAQWVWSMFSPCHLGVSAGYCSSLQVFQYYYITTSVISECHDQSRLFPAMTSSGSLLILPKYAFLMIPNPIALTILTSIMSAPCQPHIYLLRSLVFPMSPCCLCPSQYMSSCFDSLQSCLFPYSCFNPQKTSFVHQTLHSSPSSYKSWQWDVTETNKFHIDFFSHG